MFIMNRPKIRLIHWMLIGCFLFMSLQFFDRGDLSPRPLSERTIRSWHRSRQRPKFNSGCHLLGELMRRELRIQALFSSRSISMKHAIKSLTIGIATLVLSAGAFAGGGARANGSFNQSSAMHEQASMHMQSPMLRATPAAAPRATPTTARVTSTAPATAHATGQPNASCGSASAPNTPGNAASAPGSAFNPEGRAGTVYAGEQPQNSRNPVSVSQYDAACLHQH
jgi:hypothetical protein